MIAGHVDQGDDSRLAGSKNIYTINRIHTSRHANQHLHQFNLTTDAHWIVNDLKIRFIFTS